MANAVLLMCLSGALLLAEARELHQAETNATTAFKKPWFCHDLDCPPYKVTNKKDSYEIREYDPGTWVATKAEARLYSIGLSEGFKRLFNYIGGENEGKVKLAMTAPVTTEILPCKGTLCESTYTTYFYVPEKYQDKPPKPTNSDVYIYEFHGKSVAALQFGGFLVEEFTLDAKVKQLREALDKDGVQYDPDVYITQGFDPPYRLQHRHNEVLLKLKDGEGAQVVV